MQNSCGIAFSFLCSSASFSSGSSASSASREILVQHLLVKEDDSELFAQLQKRILDGLILLSPVTLLNFTFPLN